MDEQSELTCELIKKWHFLGLCYSSFGAEGAVPASPLTPAEDASELKREM